MDSSDIVSHSMQALVDYLSSIEEGPVSDTTQLENLLAA